MPRILLLLLALLAVVPSLRADEEPMRPNFVFLLVDDLRWNALGFMGDRIVQTPHIDRLSSRATVFRNAFVTTSICCVSRASILTGQWERRHGVVGFDTPLSQKQWAETYPALLRAAGYRTGFVGKYGIGNAKDTAAMTDKFDFWRGRPGQGGEFIEKNDPTRTHATARFGNAALEFLGDCTAEKPFCLSISFSAVHARDGKPREFEPDPRDEALYADATIPMPALASDAAFQRLPDFVQASEGRRRWKWRFDTPEKAQQILRDYYRLITGVDREVGRIVEELEKRGLSQNTVIIFTSDNGFAFGDRGMADKWYAYEEDIRVPLFVYDPRQPARTVDATVLNVDIAPTLLELARLPVPARMQGSSLFKHLRGEQPVAEWRTEFFYEHHSVPAKIPPVEAYRTPGWKYIRWLPQPGDDGPAEELYDLKADPLEERNLATDPAHLTTLNELRAKWERAAEELK